MPIYSYQCRKCSHKFDLLVGVTREKAQMKCPGCGSKDIEKSFASFGIGLGGYKTPDLPGGCPGGTCPMPSPGSCPTCPGL